MRELRAYLLERGRPFPLPEGPALANEVSSQGAGSFREWQAARASASAAAGEPMEGQFDGEYFVLGRARAGGPYTHVRAAIATFNSTMKYGRDPPTDLLELERDDWRLFVAQANLDAFFVNGVFSWLTTVTALNESARTGILFSLLLCSCVLVFSTGNLIASAMAMSSIIGIMITVFGMMALAGWKISMLESICMIVVVGMAVDYTVHLMHSYNESKALSRFRKAQTALTEMGVSVVSGALTTFAASVPLLFADFKFFKSFGTFIAMITFASILWAVLYLMTLAMVVGPEVDQETGKSKGDLAFVKYQMRCKKPPVPGPPPAPAALEKLALEEPAVDAPGVLEAGEAVAAATQRGADGGGAGRAEGGGGYRGRQSSRNLLACAQPPAPPPASPPAAAAEAGASAQKYTPTSSRRNLLAGVEPPAGGGGGGKSPGYGRDLTRGRSFEIRAAADVPTDEDAQSSMVGKSSGQQPKLWV
jgi:hypothetical protein